MAVTTTQRRGDLAEAAALHAFAAAGLPVSLPFGHAGPYDLVVECPDGRLARVQVEAGREREGYVVFNSCSTDHGRGREHYRGRADLFAVHVPSHPSIYVVDVAQASTRATRLRLAPTRNAQQQGVRHAADHTLERWIAGWADTSGG